MRTRTLPLAVFAALSAHPALAFTSAAKQSVDQCVPYWQAENLPQLAEANDPVAQRCLSLRLENEKDPVAAAQWRGRSARSGDRYAMYDMGLFAGGSGDLAEAVKWFRAAAAQGLPDAITQLGAYYSSPSEAGDRLNYKIAVEYLEQAAGMGDPEAQYRLGSMYFRGRPLTMNYAEAFRYTKMAAESGHAKAAAMLSRLYVGGKGTPVDEREAYFWLLIAAAKIQGSDEILDAVRDYLEKRLDAATVAAIQDRALRWKPAS
ncbi:tetratricopeptide repeat protein [Phenylobacterium conjunctum]|uniref:Tetratricopeptide repeat protein n=1 Tax=Phenylobacterium conjunctum TaxID=1298959 RepID=A0ABW3T4S8_9CAUL